MTQEFETIVRMAREAGAIQVDGKIAFYEDDLERFAALVAVHERGACAVAAEQVVPRHTECGNKIAAAIRARGDK